jgi:hypothetical protein
VNPDQQRWELTPMFGSAASTRRISSTFRRKRVEILRADTSAATCESSTAHDDD